MNKPTTTWPFLLLLLIAYGIRLFLSQSAFTQTFNVQQLAELYQHSQFAQNPKDRWYMIQDWDLYAYAGYEYLTSGAINTINIEHPPLGKYLFGVSALLTSNPVLIQILFGLLCLWLTFWLSRFLLKSLYLALLPPLLLLSEPLFIEQVAHTLLDLPQTVALLAFILVAITQDMTKRKTHISLGVLLGAVMTIKFPAAAIILGIAFGVYRFLIDTFASLKTMFFIGCVAVLCYLLMYAPLLYQHGLSGFVTQHIAAVKMHASHVPEYPPLAPLKVMVLNQWPVWWDTQNPVHTVPEWQYFWPLLALGVFLSPLIVVRKRPIYQQSLLLFLFTWFYFGFINSRLFFPHYLFPLLPLLFLVIIWEIREVAGFVKGYFGSGNK